MIPSLPKPKSKLNESLGFLSSTASAFSWQTCVLASHIINAELPQTKIGFAFDLHRMAQWTAKILHRSQELGLDIDEQALSRLPTECSTEVEPKNASPANRRINPFCDSLECTLKVAIECAESLLLVSDEPTRELFQNIESDLSRKPLFRPDSADAGLLKWGGLTNASLAERWVRRPGRAAAVFNGTEQAQPLQAGMDPCQSTMAFLHQNLTELELPTMEACGRLILQSGRMPWAFTVDMARQCWDEARHAQAFMDRLQNIGGRVGMFAHSHTLWDMTADQPLAVQLAIHQRIGEWVGVDGALWNADRFRSLADHATADLLEFVARDEITHVAIGNRWIRWLHSDDAEIDVVVRQALHRRAAFGKSVGGPPVFPFNRWACERAGFTSDEVNALEQAALAEGTRFAKIHGQNHA